MKIAIAQTNQKVGSISVNREKMVKFIFDAKRQGAELIIFPEFSVIGGYCYGLLEDKDFIFGNHKAMEVITTISSIADIPILSGVVCFDRLGQNLTNMAAVFQDKTMTAVSSKDILNDGDFDDRKFFKFAGFSNVFKLNGKNFACVIADSAGSIAKNVEKASWLGVDIVVVMSCSSYYSGKPAETKNILIQSAADYAVDIAYVNMAGAQDGYVFDGGSMYVCKDGGIKAKASVFKEEMLVFDTEGNNVVSDDTPRDKEMYDALVCGLSDYCLKNNFKKAVIGMSGGIDSALTCAIAVDALGKDNVVCVSMPSRYTSKESVTYAEDMCGRLDIKLQTVPVDKLYDLYIKELDGIFAGAPPGLTEENIQARIRGNILMALSNKFGYLVLCTCNKSEDAVGYGTLYGDVAGGYSVLADVLKKYVYKLSKYRNTISDIIPGEIINRAPTAELRHNQKDSDSLPEYEVLDDILEKIIEDKMTYYQMIESNIEPDMLNKILKLIKVSEYKRRQSPLGTKITKNMFVRDIQLPVTNGYKKG